MKIVNKILASKKLTGERLKSKKLKSKKLTGEKLTSKRLTRKRARRRLPWYKMEGSLEEKSDNDKLLENASLNKSLELLVNNKKYSDVCFHVGIQDVDNPFTPPIKEVIDEKNMNKKVVKYTPKTKDESNMGLEDVVDIWAIRSLLASRSPVFDCMLYGPMMEGKKNTVISIPDIMAEAFLVMLHYIYTDRTDRISCINVLSTLYAAKKYQINNLARICVEFVHGKLNIEVVFELLKISKLSPLFYTVYTKALKYL